MPEVRLAGCRPEPLSSYLKGLGLVRVLAEQQDADLRTWWQGDELWVRSTLDLDGIVDFLYHRYRPTPLLAPWNNGSGFGEADATKSPKATAAVEQIVCSGDTRLAEYRKAIRGTQALCARPGWYGLSKEQQVALCRSTLPDTVVSWLDTAVVLTADSRAFPPLLGTGGNDGRFDFASNFMQRVAELLGLTRRAKGAAPVDELARAATGGGGASLDRALIGQFDPGGAGGPGSSPFGAAGSLSNPWDFVLLLEGAVLFASGVARRLSTGRAAASVPFMVRSTAAGHPSAAGAENTRGELWAPIWTQPASYAEISRLISEGRAEFAGRQAGNALDLARSLATLGVDRGVSEFVRHAFVERNGLATFAVPVGRLRVRERSRAGLLGQLDGWLQRARAVRNAPDSMERLLRAVDDVEFELARGGDPRALQAVLCLVADLHHLAERSDAVQARIGSPIRGVRAADWVPAMDDGSAEHEVAVALASLRERGEAYGLLRHLVTDVDWSGRPVRVHGVATRSLEDVLANCLRRLAFEHPPALDEDGRRRWLASTVASPARLATVGDFLAGSFDDGRIARLIRAYVLLDWRGPWAMASSSPVHSPSTPPDPVFALVRPFFHSRRLLAPFDEVALVAEPGWPQLLAVGRHEEVARLAIHRLRVNRLEPRVTAPKATASTSGRRIAASCLLPTTDPAIGRLLRSSVTDPTALSNTPAEETV